MDLTSVDCVHLLPMVALGRILLVSVLSFIKWR